MYELNNQRKTKINLKFKYILNKITNTELIEVDIDDNLENAFNKYKKNKIGNNSHKEREFYLLRRKEKNYWIENSKLKS